MPIEEKSYVTKVGKILSRQKNPDRHTLVSVYRPSEPEEKDHGVLYFVIEIISNDPTIGRVAKIIEAVTIKEYYKSLGNGLASFEEALKRINEKLSDLADEGEIGWIGKINAVIAVLEKDVLHVTQAGSTEAYLVRAGKITHVTEGLSSPSEKPNPLKTFINIASGELQLGDKVIISTSELFYHFSLDDIRRINTRFPPSIAAAYIVKMLKKEEVESISALVLELSEPGDEESKITEIGKKIFSEEQKIVEQYHKTFVPFWRKFMKTSKQGAKVSLEKSKELYGSKIAPNINRFTEEANKRVTEKLNEKLKSSPAPIVEETTLKQGQKDKKNLANLIPGTKKELPKFQRKYPISDEQQNLFAGVKKENPVKFVVGPVRKFFENIGYLFSKSKVASQVLVIAGILLIVALVVSGLFTYQKRTVADKRQKAEETYLTLKTKVEGATKAYSLGDVSKSRSLLEEAKKEIDSVPSSGHLNKEINDLKAEIDKAMEQIFNIQRLNDITPLANFSEKDKTVKLTKVFKIGNTLYVIDKERNKAIAYSVDSKSVDQSISLSFDGNIEGYTMLSDKASIAMISQNPENLYIYNSKTNSTEKSSQITSEAWPKANAITSYMNNVYLLVPKDNQIYKYTSLINSYSTKTNYLLGQSNNLADAVDIAVDGSMYILQKNGDVLKFTAGEKNDFTLTNIPSNTSTKDSGTKIASPIRIITSQDMNQIFIADNGGKRVLVFDKEGKYVTQYISDKWGDIKDIWVDYSNKRMYILSGLDVFEVNLK